MEEQKNTEDKKFDKNTVLDPEKIKERQEEKKKKEQDEDQRLIKEGINKVIRRCDQPICKYNLSDVEARTQSLDKSYKTIEDLDQLIKSLGSKIPHNEWNKDIDPNCTGTIYWDLKDLKKLLKLLKNLKKDEELKTEEIKRKSYEELKTEWNDVSFSDLKGLDREIEYLRFLPKRTLIAIKGEYRKKKYVVEKGCILKGPPGTAKTPSIRSLILECMETYSYSNIGYYWMNVREIITGNDVGENMENINSIFKTVRKDSSKFKLYFLVMDDLDLVIKDRTKGSGANQQAATGSIMEELNDIPENVIILAATNLSIIDNAIVKRIGPVLEYYLPNCEQREEIFRHHAIDLDLRNVDIKNIVEQLDGCTGHNIAVLLADQRAKIDMDEENGGVVILTTELLEYAINSGLYKSSRLNGESGSKCSKCGSYATIKKGFNKLGNQIYICKVCNRYFTEGDKLLGEIISNTPNYHALSKEELEELDKKFGKKTGTSGIYS